MENFKERLTAVDTFIFDVDGVFTDGQIGLLPGDDFLRMYHARDGYAVTYAVSQGYRIFIISGGRGDLLERRFAKLRVHGVHSNIADKVGALTDLARREGLDLSRCVYMGDDIPDLDAMRLVGLPVCPSDACHEVRDVSAYVSQFAGGRGCVRDIIEQVLRSQGKWLLHTRGMHTSR